MYYNFDRILSYNCLFNFIMTNRGLGKTYGSIKRGINAHLKNNNYQIMYVRRYREEVKEVKSTFFDTIKKDFPEVKFKVEGNIGYINNKPFVHFVALSTSRKLKSKSYPLVKVIIYDEFLIDKETGRYIPNEPEVFQDLFETVVRQRDDVIALFLANNISTVNPYFLYYNCIPYGKRFTIAQDGLVVVEQFVGEEFVNEKKKTRFGRLIDGTSYGNYALENKSLCDNDTFIQKYNPKDIKFLFSVKYRGNEIGIWISYKEGICYVSDKIQTSSKNRFSITKDDHDINLVMYNSLSNFLLFREFVKYFRLGMARFKSNKVKVITYDILQYMNIR